MTAKQHIDNLTENINEIMSSAAHVKGPEFANAVALHFEAIQLAEAIGNLTGLLKSNERPSIEQVDAMGDLCTRILSSIVAKGMNIPDEELEEVLSLVDRLNSRSQGTASNIKQELRGE